MGYAHGPLPSSGSPHGPLPPEFSGFSGAVLDLVIGVHPEGTVESGHGRAPWPRQDFKRSRFVTIGSPEHADSQVGLVHGEGRGGWVDGAKTTILVTFGLMESCRL